MGFLVERNETENEIIIKYKKYAWYMWGMWILLGLFFGLWIANGEINYFVGFVFMIFIFGFSIPHWSTFAEIKDAMRKGKLKVTGGKYSFTSPLTYEIKK